MARVRSANQIILDILEFYRSAQPNLDTKPGAVARDLLVDGPATQIARLYEELARITGLQSLRLAVGTDLDKLSQNFGATRRRGSKSTGQALFTFSALSGDININQGDRITANNGAIFVVTTSTVVSSVQENRYRAIASKFRADLDFVGITDEFAVEVPVEASTSGVQGNISKYALNSTTIPSVSNVTNTFAFGGGSATEDDAQFRARVLAIFSGSNTGTALGYQNAVEQDPAVIDAIVIEPGDDLMTRDGTQVFEDEDGTRTVISEGSGGKVDVLVFGTRLQQVVDSFVFQDLSNTGDVTNIDNDFVLGQIEGDEDKTVTRRRLENVAAGVLPSQPINNISTVEGSLSGASFVEKSVDSLGRITGNYELIRDTGAFGGSPWGFDKLRWISDRISGFQEDATKSRFNGQDAISFTDVTEITAATQNISVVNENSTVNPSDRTEIQLAHAPITNVTRVFNLSTGERYVVADQNPNGDGTVNQDGIIKITGNTLPAINDVLQVDYVWVYSFDPNFDFDNRIVDTNPRDAEDSIDWGFSNAVRREQAIVTSSGSLLTVTVTHPISSVVDVNTFVTDSSAVTIVNGRLAVIVSVEVANVVSVLRTTDLAELYDTSKDDGSFSAFTIFLPTDTVAQFGDTVTVTYNAVDVFNVNGVSGSADSNIITLSSSASVTPGTIVECNYIANVSTILPATSLSSMPALRSGNAFNTTAASNIGTQPTTHVFSVPDVIVQNLRQAPTSLGLTISGSISPGVITVTGTTFDGIFDTVITATRDGLEQDLSSAIKDALGLDSNQSIPSNVQIVRLISMERVTTTTSLEVLEVNQTYDIKGYKLLDNSFVKSESIIDTGLSRTEIELPSTPDNVAEPPSVGDRLRVTFYISTTSDTENVSFSRGGTLYTNKIFAIVDSMVISSGFTSGASSSATLTVINNNQPITGSRYQATYDYIAPKINERITITSNFNKVIGDATIAVENTRPINADVLVKAAFPVEVDVTMLVVVTTEFVNSETIVLQNVRDAVTQTLNAQQLGTTVDSSDLIRAAANVEGVDRVRTTFFNKTGETGSVLSIVAQRNEFIVANNVIVESEER